MIACPPTARLSRPQSSSPTRLAEEAGGPAKRGAEHLMKAAEGKFSFLFLQVGVFFTEAIYASGGIHEALFACIERMATGAYFHMHFFAFGGEDFNLMAAGAAYHCLVQLRMDTFFHG
jgi:hypothetical protein